MQGRVPWGPLPSPRTVGSPSPTWGRWLQVPRKVTEQPRPRPNRHWRSRAAILSKFGQMQLRVLRVPRPPASLRLFEVSPGALICLPPAASPGRQFLVESLLTAPLLPGPRGSGLGALGSSPRLPTRGRIPCPLGKWGSAHAGSTAPLLGAEVASQLCPRCCRSSSKVCHDGGRPSLPIQKALGASVWHC